MIRKLIVAFCIVSFFIASYFLYLERDVKSISAFIVSITALLTALANCKTKDTKSGKFIRQKQKVNSGSIGIMAGKNVNINRMDNDENDKTSR